eukprot:scaffold48870_cov270-Isochrysis_galbana.AAC.1
MPPPLEEAPLAVEAFAEPNVDGKKENWDLDGWPGGRKKENRRYFILGRGSHHDGVEDLGVDALRDGGGAQLALVPLQLAQQRALSLAVPLRRLVDGLELFAAQSQIGQLSSPHPAEGGLAGGADGRLFGNCRLVERVVERLQLLVQQLDLEELLGLLAHAECLGQGRGQLVFVRLAAAAAGRQHHDEHHGRGHAPRDDCLREEHAKLLHLLALEKGVDRRVGERRQRHRRQHRGRSGGRDREGRPHRGD